ncbi:hypothetical protein GDO86_007107 [Hymenochirus boettgeri]|uniref:NEDD8-activating enzyme E1 catalytic subunit n=1 Tax=Hymenochirus boettgeri TaxID=247094 RepID=A0A8T2IXR4_9PIPI|nr:hypothetical protein GDO86_007107 [Hymenochirus boettgeri]
MYCVLCRMAVDGGCGDSGDWEGRWNHVKKFLERSGPFTHPEFEPSNESLQFLLETCKILVVGAGGLGCELLKNLALSGFRQIHVIDMDTIDVSNLNRQFLFRPKDVGRPKAEVAAEFINKRIPDCCVTPYFKKIQDFDETFYREFHIIVCGLDSIIARRWLNGMLMSLLNYEDGVLQQSSVIPLIDGGTEGFKGNARVILPGMTACVECTLELYPPQINFPMCTIASMPRLPEHCIEFVRILQWPKEQPFGEGVQLDGDDPEHIQWIFKNSLDRASQFNIRGVTYRLTQGKPMVYFSVTCSYKSLICMRLHNISPTVASIEERTRPNLCKTLKELGLVDGQELAVADVTTPQTVLFKLHFTT